MDVESFRNYCISKPLTTEELPFGPDTLVFKVFGKMFALINLTSDEQFANLKCDPQQALIYREEYDAIIPGYHMNKKHWNSVYIEELTEEFVQQLVDHSYQLVVQKMPKSLRNEIEPLL